ncbi:hypothetical protein [Nocardia arizonensis]|uniref:hypothetical protein n=1 Tax=Nocardia arizonensis TaxID=1141647 RepID=UPI000AA2DA37|nr:hypothetical protein [Nocardia arizonensis]
MNEKEIDKDAATAAEGAKESETVARAAVDEKVSTERVSTEKSASDKAAEKSAHGAVVLLNKLRPGPKGAVALRVAVALLLGASLATSVYYFLQDRSADSRMRAQEQARAAACAYAPVLANYDAKNLDPYFAAVLAGATGDWKKQFDDTSRELKEVLSQGEVVSKADDVQCAIKSADENSAEAIVVIGQTITSVGTQGKPAPGQLSMVMRMAKVDGKWLVNKVNSPLTPSSAQ